MKEPMAAQHHRAGSVIPTSVLLALALVLAAGHARSQEQQEPEEDDAGMVEEPTPAPTPARVENHLDREFRFASGLVDLGFPDFAEKVVEQVLRQFPAEADRAKLIRAQIFISRRKFAEAEELLKGMGAGNPKAQAISLALAAAYYRLGEMEKAKAIYGDFFKQYEGKVPTDQDLLRFYQETAFQYAQMLEQAGDAEGAVGAYEKILATKPEKSIARKLISDQNALYLKLAGAADDERRTKYLGLVERNCVQIEWGGIDIWFGQAQIARAQAAVLRGDKPGAQKVLKDSMDILREVDGFMKEQGLPLAESPMAGARFLLGELYEEQGTALAKAGKKDEAKTYLGQALKEYANVFVKYGDSDWGSEAGVRRQRVTQRLTDLGFRVAEHSGAGASPAIAQSQYRMADNLFMQKQYKGAVDEYRKILNAFPETDQSPAALAKMALSYAGLGDTLSVKMVTEYLGERFAKSGVAADAVLTIGRSFYDGGNTNMLTYVYESYVKHFPQHDQAAGVLYMLAGARKQAGDAAGAIALYQRVVDNYPKDRYYTRALSALAWDQFRAGQYDKAIPGFEAFVAASQAGFEKAQAQFALADCHKQVESFDKALGAYEQLIGWLVPKDSPYNTSADVEKKNKDLLEKAAFSRGFCLSRMGQPPESVPEYRARATKAYEQFLQLFAQSPLAPRAMNGLGAIQLELGQFEQAAKTFEDLALKYPDSEEGKSALYSLLRSAMEVKKSDVAKTAFQKMMQHPEEYKPDEFNRVGQLMLDAGLFEEAAQAFGRVAPATEERALLERALYGLGRASFELKRYDEAATHLSDLMTRYPKSGLFYDAKFTLGSAYRALGRLDEAIKALSDVFKFADDAALIARANFTYGQIEEERGNKESALASYQRVALLADADNPELRPIVEQCLLASIRLAMELKRYQDVLDSCDQYLKVFPESDKIEQIRKTRAEAKLEATRAEAAPPAPATTQPAPAAPR